MSYVEKLNPEQKMAVQHESGPLLIVAGAGTGKTTVITERVNWLMTKKNLNPDEVLALTFTEKAAAEMEERVDKALPYGYVDLWISTFHSFAERILKEHGLAVGLTTDFKLLDDTAAWLLVRNNFDAFDLDYYRPLGNPNKFIHSLLKHFSKCKDEMVTPKDYLDYAESYRLDNDLRKDEDAALEVRRLEEVANAYHIYQQLLLNNDYLDFGDLINYAYELFQKRPQILKKYQEQFKYILVDEFQDTNYAQYQLIKLLARPKNNITVVGDDDQAIYKFRGASISNILEFKKDYPKCEEVFLNTNYRTKQNILDIAYKFIQLNNPNRLEVQLKLKTPARAQPTPRSVAKAKLSAQGRVGSGWKILGPKPTCLGLENSKLSKELKSAVKGKGIIEHLHTSSLDDEVASVVNKISQLGQKDNNWNQFAILVRANDQAKPFIEGLERANIPYQFVASRGLYAKPIVLNLIAFLKLLDNFHESDAMYRYLTMPIFNLDQSEIIKITHQAYKKRWTLFETVKQAKLFVKLSENSQKELDKAVRLLERFILRSKDEKCSKITFNFLNDSGYLKYIDSLGELEKRQQFSYLGQFYKRIKAFEEINDDKSVKNFLNQLGLELESGEQGSLQPLGEDEGPEMVKVMTVHGAKGLEFKYVFLVNLVDMRFPSRERREPIELPDKLVKEIIPEGDIHLQEERRLFYVGLTRAKEGLFLTSADDYGGVKKKKISVFLSDLGFKQSISPPRARLSATVEKLEGVKQIKSKAADIIKEFLPPRFSYTQIKDFQNCPRLYYYRYILKVPLKGNHHFSFGSTIHLTLQKFYEEFKRRRGSSQAELFSKEPSFALRATEDRPSFALISYGGQVKKQIVSLDELLKFYEESWIDDWYESRDQKERYFKKGKELLKLFYESPHLLASYPIYLEKMFNIKVGEYTVNGKIDRIDEIKDGFKIIDYKTGQPLEKLAADDKEQLLIYQMAASSILSGKVKELAYYYLGNDSQLSFLGKDTEIKNLQEKIIKTIEEIKNFDFVSYIEKHDRCWYCEEII